MDVKKLSDQEFNQLLADLEADKARRATREAEMRAENQASMLYHSQIAVEVVKGIPVWQRPTIPITGYYSGALVWHNGTGWQNDVAYANLAEPGTEGSGWTSMEEAGTGYYPGEADPGPLRPPEGNPLIIEGEIVE